MMSEKIYEELQKELEKNRIEEDVEDVLFGLAEGLADLQVMDKAVKFTESYGKAKIEAEGICSMEEEEVNVLIKKIRVGKKEFEIDDYFL